MNRTVGALLDGLEPIRKLTILVAQERDKALATFTKHKRVKVVLMSLKSGGVGEDAFSLSLLLDQLLLPVTGINLGTCRFAAHQTRNS